MVGLRVIAAMLAAIVLKTVVNLVFSPAVLKDEIHGIASYVELLGGIYSIVIAFLIYVVWEQFNRVQVGLSREASAMEDLCRVAGFMSNRNAVSSVRVAARQYLEAAAGDEYKHLAKGELSRLVEDKFAALCTAIRGAEVVTQKDGGIYGELLRGLARVSDARDDRLAMSTTRIPNTLWSLVVFASCAVLAEILLLGIGSYPLAISTSAAAAGTITFLLSVVKDMDNPFAGVWNVSYGPLKAISARIGTM
jgi:hypothetical protein